MHDLIEPRGRPGLFRLTLATLLMPVLAGWAVSLQSAEAWFDTDPGIGNGTAISVTQGDPVQLDGTLSTNSLAPGIHRLYLRTQDELGRWSLAECRIFEIRSTDPPHPEHLIEAAEVFIDADPGEANGFPIDLVDAPEASLQEQLDLAQLMPEVEAGVHRLYLRVRDSDGRWSQADVSVFQLNLPPVPPDQGLIIAAEYFFDLDPGTGQGYALVVSPGSDVMLQDSLSLQDVAPGLHTLHLRAMDEGGRWSTADSRMFYLKEVTHPPGQPWITAAEYFIDTDPGAGSGVPIAVPPGSEVLLGSTIDITGIAAGLHLFHLRLRDETGEWSLADSRIFELVTPIETSADQHLAAAEFFINVDPGVGNGVPIPFPLDGNWDGAEEIITHAVSDIPVGHHVLGLRFRDTWGSWSAVRSSGFLVGPWLSIQAPLPPTLSWEGDLGGSMIHVYRSMDLAGPWSLIASTLDATYIDEEITQAEQTGFYRVTQEHAGRQSSFKMPE